MSQPWRQIVETNVTLLVTSVRRIVGNDHDAEDVVQEVFYEAYRLSQTETVKNWTALLRRMAQRRAIDLLRRRSRQLSAKSGDDVLNAVSLSADASEVYAATELQERLRIAISKLPDREADAFTLAYFDGLTRAEIATVLQTTTNAVSIAIHKARQRLQKLLEEK